MAIFIHRRRKAKEARTRRISIKHYTGDIILIYRLIAECPFSVTHGAPQTIYSLSITKIDNGGERREVKYLRDISRDFDKARRIFKTLSRGCVTPCTAAEIVSDIIGT